MMQSTEGKVPFSAKASILLTVQGKSRRAPEGGTYIFEAWINGRAVELRVSEEIAFDLLQSWTLDPGACLTVLRQSRTLLAEILLRKIEDGGVPDATGSYALTWQDYDRMIRNPRPDLGIHEFRVGRIPAVPAEEPASAEQIPSASTDGSHDI